MNNASQYASQQFRGAPLIDRAHSVCETVIGSGLGIREGKICKGGNNEMAYGAANAFPDADLHRLIKDVPSTPVHRAVIQIITLAKRVANKEEDAGTLDMIAMHASVARSAGFLMAALPHNYDLNLVGAKLTSYKEPSKTAQKFAQSFGIVPRSSHNISPKPGVK